MPWTVNDQQARNTFNQGKHVQVPPAAMKKYYEWRQLIQGGSDPKSAADEAGDMHYEKLKNTDIYTIRLSQEHRVVFKIIGEMVQVIKIGGHYP